MGILTSIQDFFLGLYSTFGDGIFVIAILLAFIGIVAQWRLYEKASQPGIASIVPIWNFIVFLRIVGRPASHIFLFLIPVYGQLYMIPKVYIELCDSFGKHTLIDYILVLVFNAFYVLNLGLSYEVEYVGPAYQTHRSLSTGQSQSAIA